MASVLDSFHASNVFDLVRMLENTCLKRTAVTCILKCVASD